MICLLAGAVVAPLLSDHLTLRWLHSVERIPWEEDWIERDGGLKLIATRVRGSGAGMEPSPDARFVDGAWTWKPRLPILPEVVLRRSGATADWDLCTAAGCRPMGAYVGPDADPVVMKPCPGAP